jgi:hypothetical protein
MNPARHPATRRGPAAPDLWPPRRSIPLCASPSSDRVCIFPLFLVMIDRQGNVAFHSGIGAKEGVAAMKAIGKNMGLDESTMTEADFYRLWEVFFSREIEKILNRP